MAIVYVASPLKPIAAPNVEPTPHLLAAIFQRNISYAKLATLDSLVRGESPLTVRVLYTSVLSDRKPSHRKLGMTAGKNAIESCTGFAAYLDLGWSDGMADERNLALAEHLEPVERLLFDGGFAALSVGGQVAMILDRIEALHQQIEEGL